VGYRVPGQVLDLANLLLPATGAAVVPSRSVRTTPVAPRAVATSEDELDAAVAEAATDLLGRHSSVAVIGAVAWEPPGGADERLTVVAGEEAKGLEFDGVVVVEPARFTTAGPRGVRLLYIAMTRAVQELVVVHAEPLPAELAEGLAAGQRDTAAVAP
jgi:hypothetical protein